MPCDERQEQASRWIDSELGESEQILLFRHLEGCPDCRLFLDSMVRFRSAAKKDRDLLFQGADELLPPAEAFRKPFARPTFRDGWIWRLGAAIHLPAPVAVGLALVLVVFGILVGSRFSTGREGGRPHWGQGAASGERRRDERVVVVCGLPEVDVLWGPAGCKADEGRPVPRLKPVLRWMPGREGGDMNSKVVLGALFCLGVGTMNCTPGKTSPPSHRRRMMPPPSHRPPPARSRRNRSSPSTRCRRS